MSIKYYFCNEFESVMLINFGTKQLEKLANNSAAAIKKWGAERTKLFNRRLAELQAISSIEDLKFLPGKHHPLKNERKGQWACNLDGGWRLVYRPIKKEGKISYEIILIEEVIDYH
ncbi:type II toxin-antitoxin system RelE/ParE family toxin [Leeuwenhoekiella blandensis]|uniref:type II toxin-antitoxin system RelE/ParE family toxin n=1 Tax=Leeuwenhoekiella blandensis TaxID=360293 RepID=UPI002356CE29|nr:type II toxin-antitoxin system RelE/ParE family toxin [Leeuwenhoekiella blandensis]|tara:strand:- start:1884 stop:2231 length:348 start_codon:yes stop_codon:yes gene_type:complete